MGGPYDRAGCLYCRSALGGLIGWAAAWIILKQRLDHYKERIEYFKERANPEKPDTSRPKKERLQQFYLEGGSLLSRKIEKENPDDALREFEGECDEWLSVVIPWVQENMGDAARARVIDRSGYQMAYYTNAANKEHGRLISVITDFRKTYRF